ncbi:porin signal peptide protein [Cellvibrio sp. BR]|uniref:porin n=1 Tax=Cellvibrio sp. BR TaxID=1134474 RepID=UPI00026011F7|nr:porin [Cellvibrio sp. BR]EIK45231.1 porin signal peptide protein [Cellvibrio sp. BR]
MKKSLLAFAVASLFPMAAVADVIVYGKANVSLQSVDEAEYSTANGNNADGTRVELVSNASRIGVKGGEAVNSSLKVIYQFEYQTEVDDGSGSGGTFSQRNIYLGLQGTAGTIMGGHFDTPTKVAQEKIDLFNDLEGDITNIFKGEIRASNIVQYTTPTFGGGFAGSVAYVTEENDGTTKKDGEETAGASASFGYTSPVFYVGVAMDQDVEAKGVDLIRLVGRLNLGAFQFGVLVEDYADKRQVTCVGGATAPCYRDLDEDGALVSALWNINDKWALKTQYGDSDVRWIDGEAASIGVDYKMTKSATLYGYYTQVQNGVMDVIPEAPITDADRDNFRDDSYVGIGMDYKF